MSGILVGVDGSDHSHRALSWAMHEAAYHHAPLTVMAVHPRSPRPSTEIYWNIPELPDRTFDPERARTALQDFAGKLSKDSGDAPSEITVRVATGDPATELISAARDADLLVVGSRGSGRLARLLIGSVSSKVAQHAPCPVVIVPETA
jgi:nucleotide-binding universal stress UspA family protein